MSEYDKIADRATHTPEPWQLFPHGRIQNADGLGVVAYLATFETEWKTNSNLIVAAPDLLAVAEMARMAPHDSKCPVAPGMDNCECHVKQARAAIAKARGSV